MSEQTSLARGKQYVFTSTWKLWPIKWFYGLFKKSIVIISLLLIWEIAPLIGLVDPVFCPPLHRVLQALYELIVTGELWNHFSASIGRSLIGFFLAIIIAIPIGLLIGWYPLIRDLLNPILELFRNTATLALLPVFILLLGIGEVSKIAIVLFACTFPILMNTINAVKTVDPLLIKSGRTLGMNSFHVFIKVILPASIPTIFTGIRLSGSASILVLIAAEMVGAKEGLGFFINSTQMNFQIPQMYAGIITIAFVGIIMNVILVSIERKFSSWKSNVKN